MNVLSGEGGSSGQPIQLSDVILYLHDIEDDTGTKDVSFGVITFILKEFWRYITGRAAPQK